MSKRTKAIKREEASRERGFSGQTYFNMDRLDEMGSKLWKSQEGDNFIAIVPPPDPDAYFGLRIFPHFSIGFNNSSFLCPRMMTEGKRQCVLCEEYRRLKAADSDDEEKMRNLNPYPPRYLFWIVDMSSAETQAEGVQLYDAPMTVNDEIISLSKDRRTGEFIDVSDPVDGYNVLFERVGTKLRTSYRGFKLEERDPLPDEWLKQVIDLSEAVIIPSSEDIQAAWSGEEEESEENKQDDEYDEEPRRTRRPPTRRRIRDEEEEDEEREPRRSSRKRTQERDEDEEEDERPSRRKSSPKRTSRRQEPEEEDEEDTLERSRKRLRDTMRKRKRGKKDEEEEIGDDEVPF